MKLLTLLTTLTLSTTLTLAVPLSNEEDSTQTTSLSSAASSSVPTSSGNSTCPPSHRSKQCCTSINGIADSIFGQVGEVIPILKDVKLSSIAAFDCKGMNDDDSHDVCRTDVMCCDGDPNKMDKKMYKMQCKPYDKAMEDKAKAEKISKDRPLAAALDRASSADAYHSWLDSLPASTPLVGASSSSVAAAASASATPTAAATPTAGED